MARPWASLTSACTADPVIVAGNPDQWPVLAATRAPLRLGANPLVAAVAHGPEGKLGPHRRGATASPARSLRTAEHVAPVAEMGAVNPSDLGRGGFAAVSAGDWLWVPASVAQSFTLGSSAWDLRLLPTALGARLLVVTLVAGPAQGAPFDAKALHRMRAPACHADENVPRSAGLTQRSAGRGPGRYGVDSAALGAFLATRRVMPDASVTGQTISGVAAADRLHAPTPTTRNKAVRHIAGAADPLAVGAQRLRGT